MDSTKTKTSSIIGKFTGKCCDSNVFNNNDMHLSREVFETLLESEEYKRAMKNKHYIGFVGHPENPDCQDYEHACIVMTDMRILDNGEIEGDLELIDTPVGRVVKAFTDAGVKFGISIRGVGEVDSNGEVDPGEFIFRGFDLVTFPAYDDCIPEFKAIAASTDMKKKATYKKICASIDSNLKDINSCEALRVIQEQLPDGSDEFNKVQERIDELVQPEIVVENIDISEQKLEAMTQLYLEAAARVRELEQQVASCQSDNQILLVECNTLKQRKARLNRIVANQIEDSTKSVEEARAEVQQVKASHNALRDRFREVKAELKEKSAAYDREVLANTKLHERLSSISDKRKDDRNAIKASEDLNLKYQRKIEANSETISQKDSEIEELKSQLNETVIKCSKLESKASNLDEKNGELLSRVEAAEEMVYSYQQAYANLYANALGVHLTGLPVTASTSIDELKEMINAGTSTANIPAAPRYYEDEEEEYIESNEDDDNFGEGYSADLVTL